MSIPVPEPDREVARAEDVTESTSESVPGSSSLRPLSQPLEIDADPSWTCSKCGETVDAGFLVCWSCGTSIEGVEDPSFVSTQEMVPGDDEPQAITFLDDEPEDPELRRDPVAPAFGARVRWRLGSSPTISAARPQ